MVFETDDNGLIEMNRDFTSELIFLNFALVIDERLNLNLDSYDCKRMHD